jgi:ribonuclease HII
LIYENKIKRKVYTLDNNKMPLSLYLNKDVLEVGTDEVARGCLLGRVYAAAVIWPQEEPPDSSYYPPIRDSKKLTPKKREQLKEFIEANAIAFAVSYATEQEIDKLNILAASQLAMHRALDKVRKQVDFDHIIVDGNYFIPFNTYTFNTFEKGDDKFYSIAAASILAKVYHDQYIKDLVTEYPDLEKYGIQSNMGYGASQHMKAIEKYGVTQFHRKTFKPCCGKEFTVKKGIKELIDEDDESEIIEEEINIVV